MFMTWGYIRIDPPHVDCLHCLNPAMAHFDKKFNPWTLTVFPCFVSFLGFYAAPLHHLSYPYLSPPLSTSVSRRALQLLTSNTTWIAKKKNKYHPRVTKTAMRPLAPVCYSCVCVSFLFQENLQGADLIRGVASYTAGCK